MKELKLERYGGPREEFDHVDYDGKFWNKVKWQSTIHHLKPLRELSYAIKQLPEFIKVMLFLSIGSSWRDVNLIDKLLPIQTEQIQDGDFVINGVNSTDVIHNLKYLTGLPIEELERRMLPDDRPFAEIGSRGYHGSNSDFGGFIKSGESLLEIMARDNDYVLGEGLTHQQVAKPMLQILNTWLIYAGNSYLHFELNGKEFLSGLHGFPMFQDSPFNDGICAPGFDINVENLKTKERFFYAPLCPFLIHRYGFYEGDIEYRVDPKESIEFFY